jgi:hypothetical protein
MTEEFLHYLWQYRLYNADLVLVTGDSVEILHPGVHNLNSGPDFFNARLRIADTVWAGNVEIHVFSSDWLNHKHNTDPVYDNVILHVVWRNDIEIKRRDGSVIPVLELDGKFDINRWNNYQSIISSRQWVPCQNSISKVDSIVVTSFLDRLLVERLERKAEEVLQLFEQHNHDWALVFYSLLAANLGFKVNSQAFGMLAKSLPASYLAKHADNLFQLESLLFGQAGLLSTAHNDEYLKQLRREYTFLQSKYNLSPIEGHLWKFMRMHPGNFPTLRLAQFAAIIHQAKANISNLLDADTPQVFRQLFSARASEYWDTHYTFDKTSPSRPKVLGRAASDLLLINLVAPLLLAYGRYKGIRHYTEKPVEMLMLIEGENNHITRKWQQLNMDVTNAANTQALLELKSNYCDKKLCIQCGLGNHLLKSTL